MASKMKSLSVLGVLAFVFTGLWLYFAIDIMTVSERTPVSTTTIDPDQTDVDIAEIEDEIEFETAQQQDTPLTPPTEEIPPVPEPEDRVPGTPVSNFVKEELGIEETIEEEQVFFTTATPNDTIYPQWYTTTIDAPTAWDTTTGSSSTLVAVIDTGYALDHEDLSAAWFVNSGEQGMTQSGDNCWTGSAEDKQTNNCDDDANGYVDDWRGWDFSNDDNNPQAGDNYAAGANHGTKSAGLVGARGNNGTGVASVNWQTQILPLQALFDQGYGYSSDITNAIYYAVAMGADIINMSLGGPTPDFYTHAAVRYAQQNNVIVVTSAGNCGVNQTDPNCIGYPSPGGMGYPARYNETIAVGATTSSDQRASFSSYGAELDIVAPGSGSIRTPSWSTSNGTNLYSTSSYGTSFSAPIVSGAIAMLRSQYPDITADEVLKIFFESADQVSGMNGEDWTEEYGVGRLNVNMMLSELDRYLVQLQKAGGQIAEQSTTTTPLGATNSGHTSATAITDSNTATTYCITTPQTLCTLRLDKVNSPQNVQFDAVLSNNQGMAVIRWTPDDVISSGQWDATVTANNRTSTTERLYIQQ